MIYPLIRRRTCLMAGCALTFFSATAMADDALPVLESVYAISVPYDETVAQPDAWRFTLGAGVVNLPTFSGASGTTTDAIPVLAATYGRYFIGANPDAAALIALGGYVYRDSNWRVGLAVTYDFVEPRKESDDAHLQGLGDIDRTAWAEAFVVYTFDWISARSSVLTDIGGKQRGTRVTLDVTPGICRVRNGCSWQDQG